MKRLKVLFVLFACMAVMGVVLVTASFLLIRRERYDSI